MLRTVFVTNPRGKNEMIAIRCGGLRPQKYGWLRKLKKLPENYAKRIPFLTDLSTARALNFRMGVSQLAPLRVLDARLGEKDVGVIFCLFFVASPW